MIVLLCLLNALSVAFSNLLGGVATRKLPLPVVLLLAGPSALLIALTLSVSDPRPVSPAAILIGGAAGIVGGAGIPMAYRALAAGPVGVAATVIACTSTGTVAVAAILSSSAPSGMRLAGLACCALAVLLVSLRGESLHDAPPRSVLLALAAGLAFGLFVIIMNTAPQGSGWWPLVSARMGVVVVAVLLLAIVVRRKGAAAVGIGPGSARAMGAAVAAGVTDVAGNAFLVLALRGGDLLLVAIISSIAPVLTAVLGWLLLRERLSLRQRLGVGAAVVAVALTSA